MATAFNNIVQRSNTDAEFRTWGKFISDIMAAGGYTLAFTNIDWATVLKPTTGGVNVGTEVWQSTDATGLLNNYYIRILYGSSQFFTDPRILVQVGWGQDGTGLLTGNVSAVATCHGGNSASAVPCYVSAGGGGRVTLGMWANGSNIWPVGVERTRDAAGVVQDELYFYADQQGNVSGSVPTYQAVIPRSGAIPGVVQSRGGWRNAPAGTPSVFGSNVGITPICPLKGGWLMESSNIMAGDTTNYNSVGVTYTFQVYGESMTYVALNTFAAYGNFTMRQLIRYQ